MAIVPVKFPDTTAIRFLRSVKPQLRLVAGAALMGVGKFTLPLAFPLAFKYVIDVLLTPGQRLGSIDRVVDHWCTVLSNFFGVVASPPMKLAVLSGAMLTLYTIQSVASYYRNYWGGIAGHRLMFELQRKLYSHLQQLSHSYFDRNPTGSIVSRVLNDVTQANEFVSSALIDVWMDGISLALVIGVLFILSW